MQFDIISHNGEGFLLCWYSVIRQPEPKLSKVNTVDLGFAAGLYSFSRGYS
jgi:hypothetical protein